MGARLPYGLGTGASASKAHQVLDAVLDARGFAAGDFELEEESSEELSQLLGSAGVILTVRCRSTGEERFYSMGSGSAWFGAFLMDLGRGHFADAAKHSASAPRVTVRSPLGNILNA